MSTAKWVASSRDRLQGEESKTKVSMVRHFHVILSGVNSSSLFFRQFMFVQIEAGMSKFSRVSHFHIKIKQRKFH